MKDFSFSQDLPNQASRRRSLDGWRLFVAAVIVVNRLQETDPS